LTGSWFPPPTSQRPDARLRLFCLPHGGAGASAYRPWSDHTPAHVEVVPVQLPGRETRFSEPPARSTAEVVDALIDPLLTRAGDDYALFGHSLGALLAYELAHAATTAGHPPAHLFVSGHPAPHLPPRTENTVVVHELPDEDLMTHVARQDGTPATLLRYPDLMRSLLPVLRADFQICETYQHPTRPPLPHPITAVGGTKDPNTSPTDLLAWRELTTERFRSQLFPGGHFYLLDRTNLLIDTVMGELTRPTSGNHPAAE
jgi:surfactin synthase thioesterase subunit